MSRLIESLHISLLNAKIMLQVFYSYKSRVNFHKQSLGSEKLNSNYISQRTQTDYSLLNEHPECSEIDTSI